MPFPETTVWSILERQLEMYWVTSPAFLSFLVGLVVGTIGLKKMRSREHPQAEIHWKQPPLSPWRYETLTMIGINLQSLGLAALTLFTVFSVLGSPLFAAPPRLDGSLLVSILALFAMFFTTYVTGVMVAYHLAQPWIRPASYGISEAGMMYGGSLIAWKSYNHYETGPDDGLISLYSSYSPQLRTWVLQPPTELFASVLGLIRKHLPDLPPADDSGSWQRSPSALILQMATLVLAAVLPAWWGWSRNLSWVWAYASIAFFLLHSFGIQLITRFDGRGQTPDQAESMDEDK
jgi:hypothetical protein